MKCDGVVEVWGPDHGRAVKPAFGAIIATGRSRLCVDGSVGKGF
jgi:hypothetical protein